MPVTRRQKIEIVELSNLRKLDRVQGLSSYTKDLWQRRSFIAEDARGRAFRTTRDYRWWKFWIIASPLLDALLYGALFGLLLKTNKGIDNYVGFVVIGITLFSVMNKMLMAGNGLMAANRSLIQAFTFPRSAIVFSQALRYVYDTIPAVLCAIIIALVFQTDKPLSWTIVLAIPVYLLVVIFATGLMLLSSILTALVADLRAILEVAARGWMFLSGVFYSIDSFAKDPFIHAVMTANPAHLYLDSTRDVVMYGSALGFERWLGLFAWSFGTLAVGYILFWLIEVKSEKID